jgi:uncharacterized protein YndB with AHSA1/START domain
MTARTASTRVSRIINAPRAAVYQACTDPVAIATWRVPDGMEAHVHMFDLREGGHFRISLTYRDQRLLPARQPVRGKTSDDTDTFHGRFLELRPNVRIVELVVFQSDDPGFAGEMKITTTFTDTAGGTDVTLLCEDIPAGIRPGDNDAGCRQSLQNLARLMERHCL